MTTVLPAVDADDPATWPTKLRTFVVDLAEEAPNVEDFDGLTDQASWIGDHDTDLRATLQGHCLRVFHATRLLERETAGIRTVGLRALTPTTLRSRLDDALAAGELTASAHRVLHDGAPGAVHEPGKLTLGNRASRVWFAVSQTAFDHHWHGFYRLLNTWGGEALYTSAAWRALGEDAVPSFGRPSIVTAHIDAADQEVAHVSGHELVYVFVAAALSLTGAGCSLAYFADVPGRQVETIWQPGDPRYDRYPKLPR